MSFSAQKVQSFQQHLFHLAEPWVGQFDLHFQSDLFAAPLVWIEWLNQIHVDPVPHLQHERDPTRSTAAY